MFDVGEAAQLDVNRIELDRLAAYAMLEQRASALETAKRVLLEHLGRAGDGTEWRAEGDEPGAADADLPLDEEQLMRAASDLRLDVLAARRAVAAAAGQSSLADAHRLPDVGLGATYQENFMDREAVGATVSITPKIFDTGAAQQAIADSAFRAALIEADRVLQQAQREVRTAYVNYDSARRTIDDIQSRIVALAEENAQLAETSFSAGVIDLTVLLEAQRAHTTARLKLNDLQAEAMWLRYELERAAGGTFDASAIARLTAPNDEPTERSAAP